MYLEFEKSTETVQPRIWNLSWTTYIEYVIQDLTISYSAFQITKIPN